MRYPVFFFIGTLAATLLVLGPAPAQGAETLPVCTKCLNPRVISKTGVGTAAAKVEAKVVAEDAAAWCAVNMPHFKYCVDTEVKQGGDGARQSFQAAANCTSGAMQSMNGYDYIYAGLWAEGPGVGKPMLRDPQGNIPRWESIRSGTGKARGEWDLFGGYSLSGQWTVLCGGVTPNPAPAQSRATATVPVSAKAAVPAPASPPPPQTVAACAGKRFCDETATFAAIINDFRPSVYNSNTRVVSATVKFLNKTNRPLILGYVRGAGVAIDEQGNRYIIPSPENVRGIAEIVNNGEFDPKFIILPGKTSDARFEFVWKWNGRDIIGQRAWDVDLTVREVNEVAPRQYRFGQEHALQFKGVPGKSAAEAVPSPAITDSIPVAPLNAPTPAPVAVAAPEPAAPAEPDACAGKPRCYDAGPFVAEIAQATLAREGTDIQSRVMRLNLRFRNKTNQPLTLGYVARSSVLVDNLGRRFFWGTGHDKSVTGMGVVEGNAADAQFVLRPGESRAATFTVYRRRVPKTDPDGSGYTYDLTIAQLEVLYNGQQVHTVREHTMTFPDFAVNGPSANPVAAPTGTKAAPKTLQEATDDLKSIFKKKK